MRDPNSLLYYHKYLIFIVNIYIYIYIYIYICMYIQVNGA